MAIRRCALSLVSLASAITSTAHGAGPFYHLRPLRRVLPPASATRLTESHYCQGQLGVVLNLAAAAESWAEDHLSVHLLQAELRGYHRGWQADEVSPRRSLQASSAGGQRMPGLQFLHIRRTGGTSVEMATMLLPAGQKAFASLFHGTVSCLQAKMYPGKSLAETYNVTHENKSKYSTLTLTSECYHSTSIGTGATRTGCIEYHYRVGHSTLAQAYHEQGPTFCIVREPSERILSAVKAYHEQGPTFCIVREPSQRILSALKGDYIDCTVPACDGAIRKLLEDLHRRPYADNCLDVHQAEFGPYCQHILHTEACGCAEELMAAEQGKRALLAELEDYSVDKLKIFRLNEL